MVSIHQRQDNANKGKLLDMMVDAVGTQLGMHSTETFMYEFLPQVDTQCRELFGPAVEQLTGDEHKYWHEQIADTDTRRGDWLALCTEQLFECFKATFAQSSFEFLGE